MTGFEKVMCFLNAKMEEPVAWGWFHLLSIGLGLLVVIYLRLTKEKDNEKRFENVLFTYGLLSLVFEIVKQVIWSYDNGVWDYTWYAFPFQFCTTPLIVCVLYKFIKNNGVRESIKAYLAFFTILASISVMLMPDSCFTETIEVNIHTMVLHMGALVISLYILLGGFVECKLKIFFKGYLLFILFVVIAIILDVIMFKSGIIGDETFNMFYISPYFESSLPVFSIIQKKVAYPIFLFSYLCAFFIGGFILFNLFKLYNNQKKKI